MIRYEPIRSLAFNQTSRRCRASTSLEHRFVPPHPILFMF